MGMEMKALVLNMEVEKEVVEESSLNLGIAHSCI
jgi:hypothetical protein